MTYHISELLPEVLQDLTDRPKIHTLPLKAADRHAQDKQPHPATPSRENKALSQAA